MKMFKHFSFQKLKQRMGDKNRKEKTSSECEEKSTQTEIEIRTQENSSQVNDNEILVSDNCELVEKFDQDSMIRGTMDKSVIYHELDFSLKNPILYCNNGGIIVRSRYTAAASKSPSGGASTVSTVATADTPSKQLRSNKARSCGFDIVQGKINRPGVEVSPLKNGKSHQDLTPMKSRTGIPFRNPIFSPKFKKNEKCSKKTNYQGLFRSKKTSQQSLGCDREKTNEDDDYMFLDFSKNIKEKSGNRTMNICGKTSTL